MTYRHHGLFSMVLFTIAVLTAMVVIARSSWWAVAGFAALNILSGVGIAYFYCAKCLCRPHHCSHFVIGMVADWLPRRAPGPYTLGDYLGMLASAAIVFLYPLYWLWREPRWLAVFFGVGLLAGAEILLAVCPSCLNSHCPAARWKQRWGKKDG